VVVVVVVANQLRLRTAHHETNGTRSTVPNLGTHEKKESVRSCRSKNLICSMVSEGQVDREGGGDMFHVSDQQSSPSHKSPHKMKRRISQGPSEVSSQKWFSIMPPRSSLLDHFRSSHPIQIHPARTQICSCSTKKCHHYTRTPAPK
jgi:hypothetical protein